MIVSFYHKGLERYWTRNDASALRADHIKKIKYILEYIDVAEHINDINFPGSGLHRLKGDLKNYWSVIVKANWRIIFRFEDGNAYLVDYLDYH